MYKLNYRTIPLAVRSFVHEHASWLGTFHVQLSGLLRNSAKATAPEREDVGKERAVNSVLLPYLSTGDDRAADRAEADGNPVTNAAFVS